MLTFPQGARVSRKICALARVTPYMNIRKKLVPVNAFIKSQFSYRIFVWMCHGCASTSKINRLDERCLRIMYFDKVSSYEMMLQKDGSLPIHNRNN